MPEMSFDGKSTLTYWGLELVDCYISTPVRKTYPIDIPGGDGQIDAMRGLGDPVYAVRTLTASFKTMERNAQDTVQRLLDELEGREVEIVAPDKPNHYWIGELHIQGAGCRSGADITITATVFPWRYARCEVVHKIPASAEDVRYSWSNSGSRPVVPELTVPGAPVTITMGDKTITLSAGVYDLTSLKIPGGGIITLQISGGPVTARYREAIL